MERVEEINSGRSSETHAALAARRRELCRELSRLGMMIRGSLVHTRRKCGRKDCRCATGGPLHEVCILSASEGGRRSRTTYVRPEQEARFRKGVDAYARAWEIVEELSQLNIQDIKEDGA